MIDQRLRKKILIVDDGRTDIDVLKDTLKDDYKLGIALNGSQALEAVRSRIPLDLIILDVMMPGMDGFEVCRRLKNDALTKEIPIIFLTAKIEPADEIRGLAAGAVDYINKPISPPVVRARVKTHLAMRALQQELVQKNAALVEADKLKRDVEQITRHDLKSPLNSVIEFSDLLLQDSTVSLSDEHRNYLQVVRDSGFKALHLVNLFLDLYKMEQGTYTLKPTLIDLVPLLRTICGDDAVRKHGKGIPIDIRVDDRALSKKEQCFVTGEALLCYSMFANLIKNALEASPKGKPVMISVGRHTMASVAIHNFGAVPPGIKDRFFEKYATFGKKSGTGLGTYSARLMAEAQKGSIHLRTSETEGTTVTVTLPTV